MTLPEIFLLAGALWALLALAAQARAARAGRLPLHALPAGSGARGILYGFTGAMLPAHKESVSLHPVSFGLGILLHSGVLVSLLAVLATAFRADLPAALRLPAGALVAAGLCAGLALLFRRARRAELRALSVPDDYVSALLVGLFLAAALGFLAGRVPPGALQGTCAALLFYLPLGKLRHALFFFLARGELFRRLGLRGVLPPAGSGGADGRA